MSDFTHPEDKAERGESRRGDKPQKDTENGSGVPSAGDSAQSNIVPFRRRSTVSAGEVPPDEVPPGAA